ncbi:MAG TPA: DUF1153 domain-containing protein [Propylenella sp.]|nr:DUF1153 domain-containing protein [Propylenella sp.]
MKSLRVPTSQSPVAPRANAGQIGLPAAHAKRWSAREKAAVVDAVSKGSLALEDACERYALTIDEFRSWQDAVDRHGVAGLRAKMIQERRKEARRAVQEPAVAIPSAEAGLECVITDISAKGARLALEADRQLPWNFELLCRRTGRSVRVCRVWQREREVGVNFQLAAPWAIEAGLDSWLLGERS